MSCPNKLWYKEIKSRQRIIPSPFPRMNMVFSILIFAFSLLSKKVHSFIQLTWLYLHVCTIISWRFFSDLTLNPYGKSWKTYPNMFPKLEEKSSIFRLWLDDFSRNSAGNFSLGLAQDANCVTQFFFFNILSISKLYLDDFSRDPYFYARKFKKWRLDVFSRNLS